METDRTRVAFIAMEKTGVPVSLSGLSVTFTWRCQVAAGYEYNVQGEMQGLKIAIFKGLDLTECLMNYGQRFMTLYRRQGSRPSPRKRNAIKQNGCLRPP